MNEETEAEICAALALAMGIDYERFSPGTRPVSRWRFNPIQVWEDTGALIEWAYRTGYHLSNGEFWKSRATFIIYCCAPDGVSYHGGEGKTAQEALVRAIYAAIKARAESEEK